MKNENLNIELYQKMLAEQQQFRNWLLAQAPEEILDHTYEYNLREKILLAVELYDLPVQEAKALLRSPCPLADVCSDWEDKNVSFMEDIRETIVQRAQKELLKQKQRRQSIER